MKSCCQPGGVGALRLPIGTLTVLFLATLPLVAQEALNNMQTGLANAQSRSQAMQSPQAQNYTFKSGDFRLLVSPALSMDWNDNVYSSNTHIVDDYIVRPSVGITATYPFSLRNLLFVNISVGYERYLKHPHLSSFSLNSSTGTGLSLDVAVKHVTFNLHDWIRYQQDASQDPRVANTGTYGTFNNTAGLSATWDLNQVTLSAGYDHQNELSTSSQFNNIDHASEMLFARAGAQVLPRLTLGLESTATFTRYSQSSSTSSLNDNNAYTVGPYVTVRPGDYFQVTLSGGYSVYEFQQTSAFIATSSQNSWYAGLTLSHQPTDWMSYSISAGRQTQLGVYSDLTQSWYVRPNITWSFIRGLNFNTYFSYQHGKQGVGNIFGNFTEQYDWYGVGFSVQHALTSRFNLGLHYRLTLRSSDVANNGYSQNLVGLELTYHPK